MDKPNVIVFGAGSGYKYNKSIILDNFTVLALADNDKNKQDTELDGYKIISPEKIPDYDYDLILVTTLNKYALEMKKQLLNMGVPVSKMRFIGASGISPYKIDPLFFAEDLCYEDKRKLFSQNVERVIIEVNSKCNRKCWFCTNSIVNNCDNNIDMSDEVFNKIVSELEEINYNQDILFSFFNEPLISEKLEERIKTIKKHLPDCLLYIYTNGDYLTRDKIRALAEAGLDMMYIDIYTNKMIYDSEEVLLKAQSLIENLELPIEINNSAKTLNGMCVYKNLEIHIYAQDFSNTAANRAESLPDSLPIPKIKSHPLPCIKNFISYHIDFRGDVWPCPNYHREFETHRQYCVGNVLEQSIYDIYIGEKLTDYRKRNFFERSTLPCRSCIWNFNTFKSNSLLRPFSDRPGEGK